MTVRLGQPQLLLSGLTYAEAPRWRNGLLYFSDMHGHKVMTLNTKGKSSVIGSVPACPSGLGFMPDGSLLIVSMEDRRLLRLKDGHLTPHAGLSAVFDSDPNDMVVDRLGRAYVGSIGRVPPGNLRPQPSPLIVVMPDGDVRIVAKDLEMPNGAVITADGRRLIVAETVGRRLTSFDVGFDGSLKNRRLFAAIQDGSPDGMCLDGAGGIWVGLPNGEQFIRVIEGGTVTHRIPTPGKMAVACALGGSDRRTHFLLTPERQEPDIKTNRRAWVSSLRVETPAAGWP